MDLREKKGAQLRRHPWEIVRAHFFTQKIVALSQGQPVNILDLGAGDCWFAEQLIIKLPKNSRITCCDIHFTTEDIARNPIPGIEKTQIVPDKKFDIILLLDVIEHIQDDNDFLQSTVAPRLNDNGQVVISVPAHPSLFTSHDTFLGHYRRYTKSQMLNVVRSHFSILEHGYLFTSLAVARWIQTKLPNSKKESELGVGAWTAGKLVTKTVSVALYIDAFVSRIAQKAHIAFPGLTVWTICSARLPKEHLQ